MAAGRVGCYRGVVVRIGGNHNLEELAPDYVDSGIYGYMRTGTRLRINRIQALVEVVGVATGIRWSVGSASGTSVWRDCISRINAQP